MVASPLQAYHQQRCNADVPLLLQASGPRLPWMETMAQLLTDQPTVSDVDYALLFKGCDPAHSNHTLVCFRSQATG
eukprot:m.8566 g.8566  ORF g.8566 m.8566 type:complete len:76 (-) comp9220_c0_seq3:425-652(-)